MGRKKIYAERELARIYKERFGKCFGMSLHEMIYLYFKDKNVSQERIKYLQMLRRTLRKEKLRNIIAVHYKQPQLLDDTSLPNSEIKLGVREITGWIYFQPEKINDAEKFRSMLDNVAVNMEKAGARSVDLAREQIIEKSTQQKKEENVMIINT